MRLYCCVDDDLLFQITAIERLREELEQDLKEKNENIDHLQSARKA